MNDERKKKKKRERGRKKKGEGTLAHSRMPSVNDKYTENA